MKEHDSKETFHYLDPPYYGSEKVYKEGKDVTPEQVCNTAKKMKGKVMISYNDHPEVRKHCKGMRFENINTKYSISQGSSSARQKNNKEVLITNY